MKRTVGVLVVAAFVLSTVFIAYAVHVDVAIPYESLFLGEKSSMPMANAGDLRHHIVSHMPYKKEFSLWPGKGEKYEGTEPHGSLLTTYVNDRALKAIKKKSGMENNAIIVKENYAPNKDLVAVTVMYKIKGFNPEGGDWFWAKYGPKFEILAEGKVKGCLTCHGTVKENDYIFTGEVK
jgi:hypothetical protein